MKRKYLNGQAWDWVDASETTTLRVDDFCPGTLALTDMRKVKRKIIVSLEGKTICCADDGYKWLAFLPDNENWCMTAMYDACGRIIEWYFDITKANYGLETDNPYYDDLYLDIAMLPDGRRFILDEDELLAALDSGDITKDDFDMAYDTCNKLLKSNVLDKDFINAFCGKYLREL